MLTGLAVLLVGTLPVLLFAAGSLYLACRLAKVEAPSYGACVGWVFVMGFAARGGALVVRNHIAPDPAGVQGVLLQAACYILIPFVVVRFFICSDTMASLRVHLINLLLTTLVALAGFAVYQQLA